MELKEKHKIITGSFNMFSGNIISSIFNFFKTLIIAKMLGPATYGVYNILMVIFGYGISSHVGLVDGMNKQMPYLRGKGDFAGSEKVKDVTFWAVSGITVFFCLVLVIAALIFKSSLPSGLFGGLLILSIVILSSQIYIALTSLLRTDKKFGLLASNTVFLSICSLFFIFLFLMYHRNKLIGVLLGTLLGYFLSSLYILWKAKYKFKLSFDYSIIKNVFSIGFPLIIIQLGYSVLISIDRWMISGFFDKVNLGYYSIGITLNNFLYGAFSAVAFTVYPIMLEKFGKTNNPKSSEQLIFMSTMSLSYVLAIVCPAICFIIPPFIHYVLPAYSPSINCMIILIMSVYFTSITSISGNFLVSINKQNEILKIQGLTIILCIILDYIFIKTGLGINGVAIATGITYFFYGTSIMITSFSNFTNDFSKLLVMIKKIYSPLLKIIPNHPVLSTLFISSS